VERAHQGSPQGIPDTEQRQTWQGFGDGFTQSVEMALIPAVFAFVGLALDRWLGIVPVLTVSLAIFGMVGSFARAYYTYTGRIAREERNRRPWEHRP